MNLVSQDPFNSIIAYLPDLSINALKCISVLINDKISKAEDNDQYWKEHTEVLLGKKLKDRELVHWKEIYNILSEADDNTKLIITSIKHNNPDALSILIEAGIDPSYNNKSVMIEAVRKNNPSIMKILLDDGRINPAIGNDQPIILASRLGLSKIVEILLKDKRVNPNAQNGNAIISAIDKRHTDVVRILMDKNVDLTIFNNRGYPVSMAAYKGYPEILEILLKDPRIDPTVDDNGLILVAAEDGNIDIVKLLLKDFRVISATDALVGAIEYHHYDVVELLLQSPKVNPPINNNYLLFLGSRPGGLDILELLLRHPKINVFNDTLTKDLNLYPNVKEYIRDSLNGLIALQYSYNANTTKNIYRDKMENDQNIIGLYYKFLRYIIRKKPTLIMALENLTKLIQAIVVNETRSIIHNATLSVLNITNYSSSDNVYFFAFRGFLMLSHIPHKYSDILKILENEGANKQALYMTAKLLGAQLGLNKLIDSGLTISNELKQKIVVLSKINLLDLID